MWRSLPALPVVTGWPSTSAPAQQAKQVKWLGHATIISSGYTRRAQRTFMLWTNERAVMPHIGRQVQPDAVVSAAGCRIDEHLGQWPAQA